MDCSRSGFPVHHQLSEFAQTHVHQVSSLLLLSHFSRVRVCATPQMAAHQAPPSLGFSRQEHWSGLPFLFPMHESEKWKWSRSVVSDPQRPHGLQPSRLLRSWDFPGKSTGVGCHCLIRVSSLPVYKSGQREGFVGWKAGDLGKARAECVFLLTKFYKALLEAAWY